MTQERDSTKSDFRLVPCALCLLLSAFCLPPSAAASDTDDVTVLKIGRPVVRTGMPEQRIALADALALAGVENPTIGRALEAVRAAQAELLGAQALLLPTLNAGSSFNLHRGNLLSAGGVIQDVHRESVYVGNGVRAVGSGTVTIPGVQIVAPLADAVFEPQVARRQVEGRRFDSEATRNRVLLDVAVRYLALAGAETRLELLRRSGRDLEQVEKLTASFAQTKQGRQGDADRARAEAMLLHAQEQQAEGEFEAVSASLAQLLNLDPSNRLRAAEQTIPLLQLVDPAIPVEQLFEVARNNRPEVGARSADVARAEARLRQERVRPFLPTLVAGFSAGGFGGGGNQIAPRFGNFDSRTDFDVTAYWTLANLGLGNLALQRERRADIGAAEAQLARTLHAIDREVADAHAVSMSRRQQVDVALRRVRTMEEGFRLDLVRARNLQGRPIELLNSVNLLTAAREALVQSLVGYDQAQFRLFVALGQPPDLARCRVLKAE